MHHKIEVHFYIIFIRKLAMFRRDIIQNVFCVLIILSVLSCDIFVEVDNVFDPQDVRYLPPMTEIFSGPGDGDTLSVNSVTYIWRHADSLYWPDSLGDYQIPAGISYSYRINYGAWSPWTSGHDLLSSPHSQWTFDIDLGTHSLVLASLDDQDYVFEVKSMYPTDITETGWPFRDFSIDALNGPALTMIPLRVYADSSSSFMMSVKAEDVVQMMGIHLLVDYDPIFLELTNYSIQSDEGEFLLENQVTDINEFTFVEHDTTDGLFDLSIALAGGDFTGVSGSGIIIDFIFTHIGMLGETSVDILPESTIRNMYNETTMNEIRSGYVVVE